MTQFAVVAHWEIPAEVVDEIASRAAEIMLAQLKIAGLDNNSTSPKGKTPAQRRPDRRDDDDERNLAADIAAELAARPAQTGSEIAKSLRVRRERVDHILEADPRFQRVPPPSGRSEKAKCWALVSALVQMPGTSEDESTGVAVVHGERA